jgi:hypothetical protein
MDHLNMDLSDRAKVLLLMDQARSARPPADSSLASYFKERDEKTFFPWKVQEQHALPQWERVTDEYKKGDAFDILRAEFVAQARAAMLSPLEVLLGQYCLFSYDHQFAMFSLMSLILRIPQAHRISCHNWQLAQSMSKATKEAYGASIATLQVPLFPPTCESLNAFNTKMLTTALPANEPSGGSASSLRPRADLWNDLFSDKSGDGPFRRPDVLGAGTLPFVAIPDGRQALDTTELESALDFISRQVKDLASKSAGQQPNRQRFGNQTQQQPRGPQRANNNYQQPQQHQNYQQSQQQRYGQQQQRNQRNPRGGDDHTDVLGDILPTRVLPTTTKEVQKEPAPSKTERRF